ELNRRADQLADRLRALGVGTDTLVGLCLERSHLLAVGILGILKAGGAYVPLDPEYPADRIAFMLEDSAAAALVTEKALMERFGAFEGSRVCLDEANVGNRSGPRPQEETPLHHVRAESKQAAYVIYTSGSTGRPKGVVIPHSALVNVLTSLRREPGLRESDVLLSVTTPSFDIFGVELFLPLLVGARVVICDRPAAMDPVQLQAELDRSGATVMQATPATWQMLVQAGWPGQPGLRMFTGGESLPSALADALLARGAELWNLYGPTETTIWSTMSAIRATSQPITIGRPLASTQVYVLDAHRQPLPIGVPGELYIGGAGLARGYLNRPELTAEKFVPHPFSENPQARLYRTGDLVRWRADGNLEFLGRIDQQVKLRGFRIELGEIEAALLEHPSVAQCVVQLREDRPDDKRLIAYCVRSGRADWDPSVLTRHLLRRLPDYMVPSTIVSLESLPRTPNGKIDRRALPAPDDSRPELESQYVAPRTPLEEQLAGIWCEVLALDRVGIHDDFFTLGGHSLLAARVNARIFSVFGANLPLRRLFECPTIAGLAHDIEAQHGGDGDRAGKATRRLSPLPREQSRPNRFPLSFAQQRLWFLEQMEGELTAYNIPLAWRLRGRLNIEALRRTLEQIVHRHESLRTTYQFGDGDPVQTVLPPQRFELPISDLAGRKPEEREIDLVQLGLDDAQRRFDLTADLMLRATLVRVGDDDHALLLTMHHIASDGWSLSILRREIRLLYEAYCRGTEPDLPELPVQYADYAVWQREELLGDRLERLVAYWREQLRNVTPLELPTDGPRPPMPTYRGARCDFELSAELLEGLGALGQREGATLQMTLLAAFQLLLARYSGQTDIVVGTPIAGRNDTQIENLIGFFVNTLALRTDLSGDPTFLELLCRVRQVSLGAYDHQDLPFEMLVEKLQPERDLSRTPLAQVLFQLLSFPEKELTLAGVEVSRLPSFSRRARFDLEMHLWEHPGSLRGAVVYSVDLFDASTIERFVEHFTTLLKEIVDDAERPISALPLMTDAERQRLLVEWNATDAPYPSDKCVHEMFEEQVQRTPDAVAVVFGGEQLSYRELNQRANQVAHHLRALGVGPECLVGLCLERSLDLVVGILGILKAGGAYVPLDADYPPQRLAFILQDAKVRFVVTEQTLLGRLPAPGGRSDEDVTFKTVSLDADGAQLARLPSSNPAARAIADNLVYVIYTSGSTGTPKGVAMPHRALVNLIQWHLSEPRLGRASRTLQFASCNFDVSFQEMFTTWCCGGTLVLISEETQRDPQLLWRTIAAERVERLFVPFVALQQLALVPPSVPVGLKDIVSAGEALRLTPEIRQLLDTLNGCRLHNHYGPTESHVVTAHLLGTRSANWPTEAPIGRPIANTQVYVLDAQRQPVPSRVSGELYLGGVCLARGYLHRPELTAERFVPHPFSEDPAARLYRTGDLVRWCADGNLEFLGRIDQQVKLRGFRIELGEIEAVFLEHPLVAQCVVQLREDRPGDRRLVAYCVPAEGDRWDASGLLCHLRSRLPEYMVPSVLVRLAALPLSPNGKIDRRALPKPDESRPQLETEFAAPDAPIEQQLARIWADLLGLDRVGIDDDFFALGGHSLLAVRLVARIEKAFGRRLPLAAL
ncbi:MAG: amino acid adenylation domain-containing protein, partial [Planctomycetota bacterium]